MSSNSVRKPQKKNPNTSDSIKEIQRLQCKARTTKWVGGEDKKLMPNGMTKTYHIWGKVVTTHDDRSIYCTCDLYREHIIIRLLQRVYNFFLDPLQKVKEYF